MAEIEALLRALFAPDALDGTSGFQDTDWVDLAHLAESVGATTVFVARLKEQQRLARLPEPTRSELLAVYMDNAAHTLMLEHELRALLADFDRAALSVAPLKGGALMAAGVHRDIGGRYFNDLDILTRAKDRKRVDELLRARGFEVAGSGEGPKHLPPYRRGNVFVEVHEFAYWETDGTRVDLDRWLTQGTSLALTVAHLLHHTFVSSVTEPELMFKTLWDVRAMRRHSAVSWDEARRCSARAGLANELAGIESALDQIERGAAIEGTGRRIAELCAPLSSEQRGVRELEYVAHSLFHSPAWYGWQHALWTLLPPRTTIERLHGLEPGSPWVAGAYALRPFRLAGAGLSRLAEYTARRLRRRG